MTRRVLRVGMNFFLLTPLVLLRSYKIENEAIKTLAISVLKTSADSLKANCLSMPAICCANIVCETLKASNNRPKKKECRPILV